MSIEHRGYVKSLQDLCLNTLYESLEEGRHKQIGFFPIIYSLKVFFHLCVTVSLMLNLCDTMSES